MRIVIDLQACQTTGSRRRGIGRYSLSLALAMVRNAGIHEIHLLLNGNFAEAAAELQSTFAALLPQSRIHVMELPGRIAEGLSQNAWRVRAASEIRTAYLRHLKPDFVHVSSLFEGMGDDAATHVGESYGEFKQSVTLYDLIPYLNKETYLGYEATRNWYLRKIQALKRADLLLAISESSRREALDALSISDARVVNISSAIDQQFQPMCLSADQVQSLRERYGLLKPFVMYTGGIDYRKNVEGLIEAYSRLSASLRRGMQLVIVCSLSADDRLRLDQLAFRHGLVGGELVMTGYVPDVDLPAFYNLCELFVFPSRHEGFGLPVLEAMACGAPVIGANNSSIPEVIGHEDALFDARNVQAISDKMAWALSDSDFRSQMRAHGRSRAQTFTWDACAVRSLEAMEAMHCNSSDQHWVAPPLRPRLAFVTPLPPLRSGIADFATLLLQELCRHYDVDVISTQKNVTDAFALANCDIRSLEWFLANGAQFDRVLYQFGNSEFHAHMFEALSLHPGTVVLHDSFLSGVQHWREYGAGEKGHYLRSMAESHGISAVLAVLTAGREQSMKDYPCNAAVFNFAKGVIVQSRYALEQTQRWHSAAALQDMRVIPLLKNVRSADRLAARLRLNVPEDVFLICSFGLMAPSKCNALLLDGLEQSALASSENALVVFVGPRHVGDYGAAIQTRLSAWPHRCRIEITDYADHALYLDYLAAADIAVQLRSDSRGETSGAVLDCMASGLPVILNDHGAMREWPASAVLRLPDTFSALELGQALTSLQVDPERRAGLAAAAKRHLLEFHALETVGSSYRDAIESMHTNSINAKTSEAVRRIAEITRTPAATDADWSEVAACLHVNKPALSLPTLFLLMPGKSGIPDMPALLSTGVEGFRLEPIIITRGDGASTARSSALAAAGFGQQHIEEETPVPLRGDVVAICEAIDDESAAVAETLLRRWELRGVQIARFAAEAATADGGSYAPTLNAWIRLLGKPHSPP